MALEESSTVGGSGAVQRHFLAVALEVMAPILAVLGALGAVAGFVGGAMRFADSLFFVFGGSWLVFIGVVLARWAKELKGRRDTGFALAGSRAVLEVRPAENHLGWHVVARERGNPVALVTLRALPTEVSLVRWNRGRAAVLDIGNATFTFEPKEADRLATALGIEVQERSW